MTEQPFSSDEQWAFLEEQFEKKGLVVGKVVEVDEQHLRVDVHGIEGNVQPWPFAFMWASLDDIDPQQDRRSQLLAATIRQLEGQELWLRVVEVDRLQHHLVLTQLALTQEERQQQQQRHQELLQAVQPGEIREGVITSLLRNGGVLVDLDGLQGRIPSSMLVTSSGRYTSKDFHLQQRLEVMIQYKTGSNVICSLQRVVS